MRSGKPMALTAHTHVPRELSSFDRSRLFHRALFILLHTIAMRGCSTKQPCLMMGSAVHVSYEARVGRAVFLDLRPSSLAFHLYYNLAALEARRRC